MWPIDRADPAVGTFLPHLIDALAITTGPVLELGAGQYSTVFLSKFLKDTGREWLTYEFDSEWAESARKAAQKVVEKPSEVPDGPWSVVLIDCEGWERLAFLERLRPQTEVFVVHDSQDPWIPEEVLASFRYRIDHDEEPMTSLLSDSIAL